MIRKYSHTRGGERKPKGQKNGGQLNRQGNHENKNKTNMTQTVHQLGQ